MVGDPRRDERMSDLEKERSRTSAEQEHRLAVEPPRLRGGSVQAGVARCRCEPSIVIVGIGAVGASTISAGLGATRSRHHGRHCRTISDELERMLSMTTEHGWGRDFDPDELARLETRMWKAYYRRQPARLFGTLVQALRAQAGASWPRALAASLLLTRAAAGFARSTGDYERFAPDIGRAYRLLGLPEEVDVEEVARRELRWWTIRREMGLAAGEAAGDVITDLYAAIYQVPRERVAEAGRLRGMAAEVRDRGAAEDIEGSTGAGRAYWPQVAKLLRDSYRSLRLALDTGTTEYE
jgi:hypothetical protein